MKKQSTPSASRRSFLTGVIPATCCLFSLNPLASFAIDETAGENHKFDQPIGKTPSHRENLTSRYSMFIRTMKAMSNEWREEKIISFLKNESEKGGLTRGQKLLGKSKDDHFPSYIQFLNGSGLKNTLSFEYVEKSETVCEIKVTECLWAEVFKKENAGKIGDACICHGDYSHCSGFNSKIKMERSKTLMMGDAYCNHRYIFTS